MKAFKRFYSRISSDEMLGSEEASERSSDPPTPDGTGDPHQHLFRNNPNPSQHHIVHRRRITRAGCSRRILLRSWEEVSGGGGAGSHTRHSWSGDDVAGTGVAAGPGGGVDHMMTSPSAAHLHMRRRHAKSLSGYYTTQHVGRKGVFRR